MAQVSGNFTLEKSENVYEQVLAFGVPEEKAKAIAEENTNLEIAVDGVNVTIKTTSTSRNHTSNLVIGKDTDDTWDGKNIKNTATLEGNILTVKSKSEDSVFTRIYTPTDTGLTLRMESTKTGIPPSTRIFKRT